MSRKKGRVIVISAPSGGGKGTVIKRILELYPELCYSVSATTRQPRFGEENGKSYHFKTRDDFIDMIGKGELFEYTEYVGEFYGTPKKYIQDCINDGKDVLLEIEVKGAKQVMEKIPDAITVFITPPSMEILESRLRGRGTDSEEKLIKRLNKAREELIEKIHYTHVVINDEVDRAAKEILSYLEGQV